jgi:hypothetical protein
MHVRHALLRRVAVGRIRFALAAAGASVVALRRPACLSASSEKDRADRAGGAVLLARLSLQARSSRRAPCARLAPPSPRDFQAPPGRPLRPDWSVGDLSLRRVGLGPPVVLTMLDKEPPVDLHDAESRTCRRRITPTNDSTRNRTRCGSTPPNDRCVKTHPTKSRQRKSPEVYQQNPHDSQQDHLHQFQ